MKKINPFVATAVIAAVVVIIGGVYYFKTRVSYGDIKVPPGGFHKRPMPMPPLARPAIIRHGPVG